MNLPKQDLLIVGLIIIPCLLGAFIGYWAGYRNFRRFPWPLPILITGLFGLTIYRMAAHLNEAAGDDDVSLIFLTVTFYTIFGLILGGLAGRYLRHYGVYAYANAYSKSATMWFFLTIIIDGFIKALLYFDNVDMFKEVVFLSTMALLGAFSMQQYPKSNTYKEKKRSPFVHISVLAILKTVFSFGGGVARDQFGPIWLWWFKDYSSPVFFGIFLTFCFAIISAVFWPEVVYRRSLGASAREFQTLPEQKPPKADMLTKHELLLLPRWALIAYVARCGRQVQGVLSKYASRKRYFRTIDNGIRVAEATALGLNRGTGSLIKWHEAVQDVIVTAKEGYAITVALMVRKIIESAIAALEYDHAQDKTSTVAIAMEAVEEAVEAAWAIMAFTQNVPLDSPYVDYVRNEFIVTIRRDYDVLTRTKTKKNWNDDSLVSSRVFREFA